MPCRCPACHPRRPVGRVIPHGVAAALGYRAAHGYRHGGRPYHAGALARALVAALAADPRHPWGSGCPAWPARIPPALLVAPGLALVPALPIVARPRGTARPGPMWPAPGTATAARLALARLAR